MTSVLRIGIVGAGDWARRSHLPALAACERANVTAIANRQRSSAESVAAEFEIDSVHGDWRSLIESTEVDAVLVTSPPGSHFEIAHAALSAGKPTLVEAPLAANADEAATLVSLARANGLVTGYTRPQPYLMNGPLVSATLEQGRIGTPRRALLATHGHAWLRADPDKVWRASAATQPPLLGGLCIGIGIEFFGAIASIQGQLERAFDSEDSRRAPNALDALVRFESGLLATLQASWSPRPTPGDGLQVIGDEGTLHWDWSKGGAIACTDADGWSAIEPEQRTTFTPPLEFVDAVLAGEQHALGFERAHAELEWAQRLI